MTESEFSSIDAETSQSLSPGAEISTPPQR